MSWLTDLGETLLPGHGRGVAGAVAASTVGVSPIIGASVVGDWELAHLLGVVAVAGTTVLAPPAVPIVAGSIALQDLALATLLGRPA